MWKNLWLLSSVNVYDHNSFLPVPWARFTPDPLFHFSLLKFLKWGTPGNMERVFQMQITVSVKEKWGVLPQLCVVELLLLCQSPEKVGWAGRGRKVSVLASRKGVLMHSENLWASLSSSQAEVTLKSVVAEACLWFWCLAKCSYLIGVGGYKIAPIEGHWENELLGFFPLNPQDFPDLQMHCSLGRGQKATKAEFHGHGLTWAGAQGLWPGTHSQWGRIWKPPLQQWCCIPCLE